MTIFSTVFASAYERVRTDDETVQVRYHPAAEADLFGIFELIEAYAGTRTAARKLAEIEHITKSLVDFPYKGSTRADLPGDIRAIPAAERR